MLRFSHSRGVLASALVVAASISAAHAQTAIWNWDGTSNGQHFGQTVCVPGDIDRDGIDDVLIGTWEQSSAELRSGAMGQILWSNFGSSSFGLSFAAVGDVNADGYLDFAVGAPFVDTGGAGGRVFVVSGSYATTQVGTEYLFNTPANVMSGSNYHFGYSIAGISDVNGDNVRDIVVGAPYYGGACILSGVDGTRIRQVLGYPGSSLFGQAVVAIGDIDSDSIEDFAVGAPHASPSGSTQAGALYRVSGATGTILGALTINGPQAGGNFGSSLAVGDFDGNGVDDIAIGEPKYKSSPSMVDQGRVHVYPRASIAFLARYPGLYGSGQLGHAVSMNADYDGDGRDDLVAGSPFQWEGPSQLGAIRIYSSTDLVNPLLVKHGSSHLSYFGASVAWMREGGGDASPELVVGEQRFDAPNLVDAGRVTVYRFDDSVGTSFCFGDGTGTACPCGNSGLAGRGCQNSFLTGGGILSAIGAARVSNDSVMLQVEALPPGTSVLFYQGTSTQNGGLGVAFGDGLRCVGGTVIRLASKSAITQVAVYPNEGLGEAPISVRGLIPAAGGVRRYQAWYRNTASYCTPSSFNLSNGIELVWQP